jgi:sugar phosphate isomerase/epimerase
MVSVRLEWVEPGTYHRWSRPFPKTVDCGFVTSPSADLTGSIAAAGRFEFDYVEVLMENSGHRSALAVQTPDLRERMDDEDLECVVHLPFRGIDVGSPHEHVREGSRREIEAALDVAADLDASKAVLHPTSIAEDPEVARRLMADGLRRVEDHAANQGVEICAENMFGSYVRAQELDHLLADTTASLTVDTGHARIEGFSATESAAFLEDHADRVSHLHLNETRGQSDEHLPFGAGTLDFETVLEPLLTTDWDGTLSLEVGTENLDYIGHSKDHLEELL